MIKNKNIVIVGDSSFAEIAYEYFLKDSEYIPIAFAVPKDLRKKSNLFGLPVVDFEDVEQFYPPEHCDAHVAVAYSKLNRNRTKMYLQTLFKGYKLANYISSKAFVWDNVGLGDNVFIFEGNVIQPFTHIGKNTVLWSGNHLGHHSSVGNHNFFASHVVVSGLCAIGNYCFFGVNSTIADNVKIGDNCVVGAGSLIVRDLPNNSLVKGTASHRENVDTLEKYGLK